MIEENCRIVFNREVAPKTMFMGIRAPGITSKAEPGQFVMLKIGSGYDPLLRRPFSICRTDNNGILYILYRIVGRGTQLMGKASVGDMVSILAPLGKGFSLDPKCKKIVLVGGGMGIAPLVFLWNTVRDREKVFLAGFGSREEIVSREVFGPEPMDIAIATIDGSYGTAGLVTDLLESILGREKDIVIYACGPTGMLKKTHAMAAKTNVQCQVSLESVMACGVGACQGCAVRASSDTSSPYLRVCKDGPVFPAQLIDWNDI